MNRITTTVARCTLLVLFLAGACQGAAPRITKLEPPNWWVGLPGPMLLLTGEGLAAARLRVVNAPGVRVTCTQPEPSGHYLFVCLEIDSAVRPQPLEVVVDTPQGSVGVRFSLLQRAGSHLPAPSLSGDEVIYLIMPDRFADGDPTNDCPPQSPGTCDRNLARAYHGGDLRGIRDHLSYLRDLGITAIWITPVYDNDNHSRQDYHGYGAVDFYAVDEHLGSLAALQDLVAEAHRQNMKVFLDVVANHTGPKHPWATLPVEPDWFHGSFEHHTRDAGFAPLIDPHAPPQMWRNALEGWFADILPDLNQDNPREARYLWQNALWWIEAANLDGFRLDTFPYVSRRFWSEYHRQIRRVFPDFPTIGEVFTPDPSVASFFAGDALRWDGIDSGVTTVFDFPLYFTLRNVILGDAPASHLEEVLQSDWLYPHPERLVTFLGNHDTTRFLGEPGSSKQKLKLAFSLLLTLRGNPQIYYGDEIGMTGGGDPDNRRDFPGGFPGDQHSAFIEQGRTADEQETFSHVQHVLRLRQQHAALRRGRQWHIASGKDFYAYAREDGSERLLMILNNASHRAQFHLELADTPLAAAHQLQPLLDASPARVSGSTADLDVAARSLAIYEVK